ncbi:hypothetical protein PO909_031964 [Leuciscus waleckii]
MFLISCRKKDEETDFCHDVCLKRKLQQNQGNEDYSNQFWTVKWRLLLNEDGGSYFAFGFGKKETFYLFVICYVLIHSQMCKCMYYVILLHCCFYEMPVFQNLSMLFFVFAFLKQK